MNSKKNNAYNNLYLKILFFHYSFTGKQYLPITSATQKSRTKPEYIPSNKRAEQSE